jgi:fatty-acid desaturase
LPLALPITATKPPRQFTFCANAFCHFTGQCLFDVSLNCNFVFLAYKKY